MLAALLLDAFQFHILVDVLRLPLELLVRRFDILLHAFHQIIEAYFAVPEGWRLPTRRRQTDVV